MARMHFKLPHYFDNPLSIVKASFENFKRWCPDKLFDVVLVLFPSSRVLRPVLSAIEWMWTGHPTVGASLMWRRKLEESSLRSTSMKNPASRLR